MQNTDKESDVVWDVDRLWRIITGYCNLRCGHCYIESPKQKYKQLSFDDCIKVIEQANDAGIKSIFITGGEPFIRNDFLKIIDAIYAKGMKVSGIESNGVLLNEQIISHIKDKNIIWHISYDGRGAHDNLRGMSGAERDAISAIKLLLAYGFKVDVNTTLSYMNFDKILDTYNVLTELPINSWQIFPVVDIGCWKDILKEKFTLKDEGEIYLKILHYWFNDNKPFGLALGGVFNYSKLPSENDHLEKDSKQYICDYFKSTIAILPDGKLVPCCRYITHAKIMSKMEAVFQRSIKEQVQNSPLKQIKNIKVAKMFKKNNECEKCSLLDVCQLGCRINAYLESGDIFSKENRNCLLMKNYYDRYIELAYKDRD
jgi:radical SAM protein with 4Fe4S-binding SPASM domain